MVNNFVGAGATAVGESSLVDSYSRMARDRVATQAIIRSDTVFLSNNSAV